MPVSPVPHEGPEKDADPLPDPVAKANFQAIARKLFAIDRADFERVVEADKAERAAARATKKKGAP